MRKVVFAAALLALASPASTFDWYAGSGKDGELGLSSLRTEDSVKTNINGAVGAGSTNIPVAGGSAFVEGDLVFLMQMFGTGVGQYEFCRVLSTGAAALTLSRGTVYSYQASGAQVIRVSEYSKVTLNTGATWDASSWNGTTGGVLAAVVRGSFTMNGGLIGMTGKGFSPGRRSAMIINYPDASNTFEGEQAFGHSNNARAIMTNANGNGGGGGDGLGAPGTPGGGGGGGNAASGSNGGSGTGFPGTGGGSAGNAALSVMVLGGGGGSGGGNSNATPQADGFGGAGGSGGGIVVLVVGGDVGINGGGIVSNGGGGSAGGPGNASNETAGGGGGAGGSVRILSTASLALGSALVQTAGGGGGAGSDAGLAGGAGSVGRIAMLQVSTITGTTTPAFDASSPDGVTVVDPYALPPSTVTFTLASSASLTATWVLTYPAEQFPVVVLSTRADFAVILASGTGVLGQQTTTWAVPFDNSTYYFKVKAAGDPDSNFSVVAATVNAIAAPTKIYFDAVSSRTIAASAYAPGPAFSSMTAGLSAVNVALDGSYAGWKGEAWFTRGALTGARQAHAGVALGGRVYAIGGQNGGALATVEAYDPVVNAWFFKANIVARFGLGAAVTGGRIYAVGGYTGVVASDAVEEYDPETNVWTSKAKLPTPRYALSVAAVGGKVYAIAGNNGAYVGNNDEYDPGTDAWTSRAALSPPRGFAAEAVLDGKIHLVGGTDGTRSRLNSVFDPVGNSWQAKDELPVERQDARVVSLGGKLHLFGGEGDSGYAATSEQYDPQQDTWTSRSPLPVLRGQLGASVLDGRVHLFGGSNGAAQTDHWVHDPGFSSSFTALSPNKEYFFKAKARNSNGVETAESPVFSTYTLAVATLPQPGTELFATVSSVSLTVNWSSGTDSGGYNGPGASYLVQASTMATFLPVAGSSLTRNLWAAVSGLSVADATHYLRIRAYNAAEVTDYSWLVLGSTYVASPSTPLAVSAEPSGSSNTLRVRWTTPGSNGTTGLLQAGSEFRVQWSSLPFALTAWSTGNAQVVIATGPIAEGSQVSTDVAHLPSLSTVSFRVWAANAGGMWSVASASAVGKASPFSFGSVVAGASSVGESIGLALDRGGDLHVVYQDDTLPAVRYVRRSAGVWGAPQTAFLGNAGSVVAAVDVDGTVHAAYRNSADSALAYARYDGSWSSATVQAATNLSPGGIVVDPRGRVMISYGDYNNGDLRFAQGSGQSWTTQALDVAGQSLNGVPSAIALDGLGNPHIAYTLPTGGSSLYNLKYASRSSNGLWSVSEVRPQAENLSFPTINLDGGERPRVTYYRYGGVNSIFFTRFDGAAWTSPALIGATANGLNSAAIAGAGGMHVAYFVQPGDDLVYANTSDDGATWSSHTVDADGFVGYPAQPIALDGSGNIHIVYRDHGNTDIKSAHWVGTLFAPAVGGRPGSLAQAPHGFTGKVLGVSSITWTWTDAASNELGYRLYLSSAGSFNGSFFLAVSSQVLGSGSSAHTLTALTPNTSYQAYVAAVGNGGVVLSSASDVLYMPVEAPTKVVFDAISSAAITASAYGPGTAFSGMAVGLSGGNISRDGVFAGWRQEAWSGGIAAMTFSRHGVAVAAAGGKLYAIGGHNGAFRPETEEYDPVTNVWTTRQNMAWPRFAPAAGTLGGKIYVVGGNDGANTSRNEVYDPETNTWSDRASMNYPRQALAAAVAGGRLYAVGGQDAGWTQYVESYDPDTNSWSTAHPLMATARGYLAAVAVGTTVYAVGGYDGSPLRANEAFDTALNTWSTKADMPTRRQGLVAVAVGGRVYALTGSDAAPLTANEVYDPAADTWSARAPIPTGRYAAGAAFVGGRIHVVGGSNPAYLTLNEAFETGLTSSFTALTPNTQYSFAGKVRNSVGVETAETVAFSTYTLAVATGPVGFTAVFPSSITVSWSDGGGGPGASYLVQASTMATFLPVAVSSFTRNLFAALEGLSYANTTHYLRVRAYNTVGETDFSWFVLGATATAAELPQALPPSFPDVQPAAFSVRWAAGNNPVNVTTYTVVLSTSPSFWAGDPGNVSQTTVPASPAATLSAAFAKNATYYLFVSARNHNGLQTPYVLLDSTGSLADPPGSVAPPGNFPLVYETSAAVRWDGAGNPVAKTTYTVVLSTGPSWPNTFSGNRLLSTAPAAGGLMATVTGLSANTTYYANIWAVNHAGAETSYVFAGTTVTRIETPTGIYFDEIATHSIVASAYASGAAFSSMTAGVSGANIALGGAYQGWNGPARWTARNPLTQGRQSARAVAVGGRIYVIGSGTGNAGNEEFDPVANAWTGKASMLTGRTSFAIGEIAGKIYAAAGYDGSSVRAENERYDPESNSWNTLRPVPTARMGTSGAVLSGRLHVVGGLNGGDRTENEAYDPDTDSWAVRQPMPSGRRGLATAVVGGKLYAVGGTFPDSNLNTEYDPASNAWTARAVMPTSRGNLAAVSAGGKLYALGGSGSSVNLAAVEVYDPAGDSWRAEAPIPSARGNPAGTAWRGRVYVFGGFPNTTAAAEFDPGVSSSFTALTPNTLYSFKAKARNSIGTETGETAVFSTYTLAAATMPQAGTPVFSAVYPASATVNWSSGTDAGGYNGPGATFLLQASTMASFQPVAVSSLTANSFATVEGLSGNATYHFRIRAYNAGNVTDYSWFVLGTTVTAIEAPTSVFFDAVSTHSIVASVYAPGPAFSNLTLGLSGTNLAIGGAFGGWHKASWVSAADKTTALSSMKTVAFEGRIHLLGGYNGGSFVSTHEAYDPVTNQWSTRGILPTNPNDAATEALGGKIYLVGGWSGTYLSSTHAYDPISDSWSSRASIPSGRSAAEAGASGGFLYLFGGNNGSTDLTDSLKFDPAGNSWNPLAAMPVAVSGVRTVVLGDRIYVVGVADAGSSRVRLLEYNPADDSWTFRAPLPYAMSNKFGAGGIGGKIYVVGVSTAGYGTWEYDPLQDGWATRPTMPTPRHELTAAALSGRLYVAGGRNQASAIVPTTEFYDPGVVSSFTHLSPNTSYSFKAKARNLVGTETAETPTVSTYTLAFATVPPGGESVFVALGSSEAVVMWASGTPTGGYNGPGATYLLQASTMATFAPVAASSLTFATSAVLNPLEANATHYFRVRPYNSLGVANDWFFLGSTTTLVNIPVTAASTWTMVGVSSLTVAWQANGNAPGTLYRVILTTYMPFTTPTLEFSTAPYGAVEMTATSLKENTTYFAVVTAVNRAGVQTAEYHAGSTVTAIQTPGGVYVEDVSSTTFLAFASAPVAGFVNLHVGLSGTNVALDGVFDPARWKGESWSAVASMTAARGRYWPSAATVGDRIYVFGGSNGGYSNLTDAYDPAANTWTSMTNMPTAISEFGVAPVGKKVYTVSGYPFIAATYGYDTETGSWSANLANIATTRWLHAAAALDGKVYALGGATGFSGACGYTMTASVEKFDPVAGSWSAGVNLPTARSDLAAASVGGKLYVMDGCTAGGVTLAFDPAGGSWNAVASVPVGRGSIEATTMGGRIYYPGGGYNVVYDPIENAWGTRLPMPGTRSFFAVAAHRGKVYAFGGGDSPYELAEAYDPGLAQHFSGLTPNTLYTLKARARNLVGSESPESVEVSTYTLAAVPSTATPTFLVHASSFSVAWTGNGNPAGTQYRLEASTASDFNAAASSRVVGWTTVVSTEVSGLAPMTTYYVRVQARNGYGAETAFASLGSTATVLLVPEPIAGSGDDTRRVSLGDYDHDGDLDAFAANSGGQNEAVYVNGGGAMSRTPILGSGDSSWHAAWGDYDGDGDLDALVSNPGGTDEALLQYTGVGFTKAVLSGTGGDSGSAAWGDLDNDGDLDAIVVNFNSGGTYWLRNDDGVFVKNAVSGAAGDSGGVALGDFDGDGDLDALVANRGGALVMHLVNQGGGQFSVGTVAGSAANSHSIVVGDFDADGDLDALAVNYSGNQVLLRNSAGTLTASGIAGSSHQARDAAVGDLDGDGDLDVLLSGEGEKAALFNDGSANFSLGLIPGTGGGSYGVALGDLDGDGDLDAFVGHATAEDEVVLRSRSGVVNSTPAAPGAPAFSLAYDQSSATLTVTWAPSFDVESSTALLGYSLAVATEPMSLSPDGLRVVSPSQFVVGWNHGSPLTGAYPRPAFKVWPGEAVARHGLEFRVDLLGLTTAHFKSDATYYVRLAAVDAGLARGSWSVEASTYLYRSQAPGGRSLSARTASGVSVEYSTVGASAYLLEASTAADFSGTVHLSSTASDASFTLTLPALSPNTTYYLRSGALWQRTTTYAALNPASTSTLAAVPSAAPETFLAVSSEAASLVWDRAGNPIGRTTYTVSFSTGSGWPNAFSGNVSLTTAPAGAVPAALVAGLRPNTTYFARVWALSNDGEASGFVLAGTTTTRIETPATVFIDAVSSSAIMASAYSPNPGFTNMTQGLSGTNVALEGTYAGWRSESWLTKAPLSGRARWFGAGTSYGGQVYVLGGHDGAWRPWLDRYDPVANQWTALADMGAATGNQGFVAVDGKLHSVGGEAGGGLMLRHDVYDIAGGGWTAMSNLPVTRVSGEVKAVEAAGGFYLVGDSVAPFMRRYDAASGNWTALTAPTGLGSMLQLARIGTKIYAVSGATLRIFDESSGSWSAGAAMPASSSYDPVAASIGGKLYMVNGTGGVRTRVYDPGTDSWELRSNMPTGRDSPLGAGAGGRLYVTGGSPGSGVSPVTEEFDPGVASSFTALTPNTLYTFKARARNAHGTETAETAPVSTYTLAAVPAAHPLPFPEVFLSSVSVQWTAGGNPSPATPYRLEASTASDFNAAASSAAVDWQTATATTAAGLFGNTTYHFRVKARNVYGAETGYLSLGSTVTAAFSPVGAASTFSAVASTALTLSWGAGGNGPATFYEAFLSTEPLPNANADNLSASTRPAGAPSSAFGGLAANATFYAGVRAVSHAGQPTPLVLLGSTVTLPNPPVSAASTYTAVAETSFLAHWDGNGNAAGTRYEVVAGTTAALDLADPANRSLSTEPYALPAAQMSGLASNATYYLFVAARSRGGALGSFVALGSTATLPAVPGSAASTFTAVGSTYASVAWTDGGNSAGTRYRVVLSTQAPLTALPGNVETTTDAAGGFTVDLAGLAANTTYHLFAAAQGRTAGESAYAALGTTSTAIETPSGVYFSVVSSDVLVAVASAPGGSFTNLGQGLSAVDLALGGSFQGWVAGSSVTALAGLTPNTAYLVRARARNLAGRQTAETADVSTVTLAAVPSTATPGFLGVWSSSAALQWTSNGNPAGTEYRLESSTASDWSGDSDILSGWAAMVSTTATGLAVNATYHFQVQARNAHGAETAWLTVGSTVTGAAKPAPPAGSSFTLVAQTSVTLAWSFGANPADTEFQVRASTASDFTGSDSFSPWLAAQTTTLASLTPDTTYFWRVTARNRAGLESEARDYGAQATLPFEPGASTEPFHAVGVASAVVQWVGNGNPAGTLYLAQLSTSAAFSGTLAESGWVAFLSTTLAGLTGDSTYYLRVRARGVTGAVTAAVTFGSTATRTADPGSLAAASVGPGALRADWGSDGNREADGLGPWSARTSLPSALERQGTALLNGRLYAVGGVKGGAPTAEAWSAGVSPSGTLGAWRGEAGLPAPRESLGLAAFGGRLYAVGGFDGSPKATVYVAEVSPDGRITGWREETALPAARAKLAVVAHAGWLYALGGDNGVVSQATVYRTALDAKGKLVGWAAATALPAARNSHAAAVSGGRVYVAGGLGAGVEEEVWSAALAGASVGAWRVETALPTAVFRHALLGTGGALVSVGGHDGTAAVAAVRAARLLSGGVLGAWEGLESLPSGRFGHGAALETGNILVAGGADDSAAAADSYQAALGGTEYLLERAQDVGFSVDYASSNWRAGAGAEVAGLTPNSLYFLRVRARSRAGLEGALVLGGSTRTPAAVPASAASTFSLVEAGSMTLTWASGGNPAGTEFLAAVSTSADFTTSLNTSWVAAVSSAVYGLTPNTSYYAGVLARDAGGNVTREAYLGSTVTAAAVPEDPSFPSALTTALSVAWSTAGNPGDTRYEAQLSAAPSFAPLAASTVTVSTTTTFTDLLSATTYYLRVRALNRLGTPSAFTASTQVFTGSDFTAPSPVGTLGLHATETPGVLRAAWTAPGDDGGAGTLPAGSKFYLQWAVGDPAAVGWSTANAQLAPSTGPVAPGAGAGVLVTGLTAGTSVYARVWAADEAGNVSGLSAVAAAWASPFTLTRLDGAAQDAGRWVSVALDRVGDAHAAYTAGTVTQELRYMNRSGGVWSVAEAPDPGTPAEEAVLAMGPGVPQVVYRNSSTGQLRLAKRASGWSAAAVAAGDLHPGGLAVDATSYAHISYFDAGLPGLRYARWNGASWDLETVDAGAGRGRFSSLALDGASAPHIAYYDATAGDLKYASRTAAGSWATSTVDADVDAGSTPVVALDGEGRPRIAYVDYASKDLKLASFDGAAWGFGYVDLARDVTGLRGLALDGAGRPVVTYYDGTGGDLVLGRFNGTGWETGAVDSYGDAGAWSAVTVEPDGAVLELHYDASQGDLKAGSWSAGLAVPLGGNPRGRLQAPASFGGVVASSVGIQWTWTDSASAELGWRLYGAETSTGPFSVIVGTGTLPATAGTGTQRVFTENGLAGGTTYFRYVAAVSSGGVVLSPMAALFPYDTADLTAPTVTNNISGGDLVWRRAVGTLYNVDFTDTGGSALDTFQVKASTVAGGAGPDLVAYTDVATGILADTYTADWALPAGVFAALLDGATNYISVRVVDGNANVTTQNDVFKVLKDTTPPTFADAQADDPVRRGAGGTLYDVDAFDPASGLERFQYSVSTVPLSADQGAVAWTDIPLSAGATGFQADWTLAFAGLLGDATNYVSVRAWDRAGSTAALADAFFVVKDTGGPRVAVEQPAAAFRSVLTQLSGTAADAAGVGGAQVAVQESPPGGVWFDGAGFTSGTPVWLAAAGTASWTFGAVPAWADGSSYRVVSRASDTMGNFAVAYATADFTFDASTPAAAVTVPADGATLVSLPALTGTAADPGAAPSGLALVEVRLQRASDAFYWDWAAGAWSAGAASTSAPLASPWTVTVPAALRANLASGASYFVSARASDNAVPANVGSFAAASTFTWSDAAPPAAVSGLSALTGSAPREILLTWTAPGDDGALDDIALGTYAIQYSTDPAAVFSTAAAQVVFSTAGLSPGLAQGRTVAGLSSGATYYLRVFLADDAGNWSPVSNGATAYARNQPFNKIVGHVMKSSSQGVTGVFLEAYDANEVRVATASSLPVSSGAYSLNGLPDGVFRVLATWTAGEVASSVWLDGIAMGTSDVDFVLEIQYTLSTLTGTLASLAAQSASPAGFLVRAEEGGFSSSRVDLIQGGMTVATVSPDPTGRWTIPNLLPGKYAVRAFNGLDYTDPQPVELGEGETQEVVFVFDPLPEASVFAFPNPARSQTTFRFLSALPGLEAQVSVFDIAGTLVKEIPGSSFVPKAGGVYHSAWDLTNDDGESVASGVYLFMVKVKGSNGQTGKVVKKLAVVR